MPGSIKGRLRNVIWKDVVIDLEDRLRAESVKAHEMIRDHSGLTKKRAKEAEGQARFRMWEQGFEDVCSTHGARRIEGDILPGTDINVYQPFMRFEVDGQGVILSLASMSEVGKLPGKNKSRAAGVSLNYCWSPRLDFDGVSPKDGDVFATLLVSRDRDRAGQIEEIAIGVIDTTYQSYLYFESVEDFLSGDVEAESPGKPTPPSDTTAPPTQVTMKKVIKRFRPPETPSSDDAEGTDDK